MFLFIRSMVRSTVGLIVFCLVLAFLMSVPQAAGAVLFVTFLFIMRALFNVLKAQPSAFKMAAQVIEDSREDVRQ